MRVHDERTLYIEWRHQRPAPFVFVREMVRSDLGCRSRLRGFYGLLMVPALAVRVILICIALRVIPLKIWTSGASPICETHTLSMAWLFDNRKIENRQVYWSMWDHCNLSIQKETKKFFSCLIMIFL